MEWETVSRSKRTSIVIRPDSAVVMVGHMYIKIVSNFSFQDFAEDRLEFGRYMLRSTVSRPGFFRM